jgi:chorismate mutase
MRGGAGPRSTARVRWAGSAGEIVPPAGACGGEVDQRVAAAHGVARVAGNDPESIRAATCTMLTEILEFHRIDAEAVVSCVFAASPGIDASFPAAAARTIGFEAVPLLDLQAFGDAGGELTVEVLLRYHARAQGG